MQTVKHDLINIDVLSYSWSCTETVPGVLVLLFMWITLHYSTPARYITSKLPDSSLKQLNTSVCNGKK